MFVDLIAIGRDPKEFSLSLEPGSFDAGSEGIGLAGPANVRVTVVNRIAETAVDGTIEARVTLECDRCLRPVERELGFRFSDVFVPPDSYTEEKETELKAADLDVAILDGDRLDLAEVVREQILLNLPEQVFCSEGCRGLCPRCGADLNDGACGCQVEETDPRWAALKGLRP